jgi:AcrR family transcriptional regulator
MSVSTGYEESGRTAQKTRTRNALLAAARDLLALNGEVPTVEDVAAAASISRTTAYRYFPSQAALLAAAHPEIDRTSLLPPEAGDDPAERLAVAASAFTDRTIETEPQLRAALLLSLKPPAPAAQPSLRRGRAIGWFEDALAPLLPRLGQQGVRRLAIAIRSAVGIEALVWLTDIAGLTRNEAAELMHWTAQAQLHRALAEGPPPATNPDLQAGPPPAARR